VRKAYFIDYPPPATVFASPADIYTKGATFLSAKELLTRVVFQ
jgi:hypothetical protein